MTLGLELELEEGRLEEELDDDRLLLDDDRLLLDDELLAGTEEELELPLDTVTEQVFVFSCLGLLESLTVTSAYLVPMVEYDLVTIESEPERPSVPDQE